MDVLPRLSNGLYTYPIGPPFGQPIGPPIGPPIAPPLGPPVGPLPICRFQLTCLLFVVGVSFDVRLPGMSSPFWTHHLITFFISYFINLSFFRHHSYRPRLSTLPQPSAPGTKICS